MDPLECVISLGLDLGLSSPCIVSRPVDHQSGALWGCSSFLDHALDGLRPTLFASLAVRGTSAAKEVSSLPEPLPEPLEEPPLRFAGDGRFLLLDAGAFLTKVSSTSFEAVSSQYREQNEQSARSGTWQVLQ